jgi:glycosyltransferase involved in cell wall biosynthesis
MRIGYVVDRWVELSQTFIVEEVAELGRQGAHVVVVALHESSVDPGRPAVYLRRTPAGVAVQGRAHVRWAVRSPRRYLAFLRLVAALRADRSEIAWRRLPWVAEQLRADGVDRLHAHFAWAGASAAMALSTLTGWPWALTVHARDIYAPRPGLVRKLDGCDLLVTVCRYNVDVLRNAHGVIRPVELVVCGVVPPVDWGDATPDVDIVAVGRLVEKKGFDVLLHAFRRVLDSRPQSTLDIIGTGPLADELTELATRLGLDDRLRLTGARPHAAVLDRIATAKLLCLPARVARDGDADSMPVVVKEAMARGVAVVATAVTAIPEMVDDEVGVLVPPDDASQLAAAVLRLLDDDDLRGRLGRAGRKRVEERFTLADEVGRLHAALQRMAS